MSARLIAALPGKGPKQLGIIWSRASARLENVPGDADARMLRDAAMTELTGRAEDGRWSPGAPSLLVRDGRCVAMIVRDENHRGNGGDVYTLFVGEEAQPDRFRFIADARAHAKAILARHDAGVEC
ncbi:MAG: hypothetical protein WBA25_10420 [Jannaschia sp.]